MVHKVVRTGRNNAAFRMNGDAQDFAPVARVVLLCVADFVVHHHHGTDRVQDVALQRIPRVVAKALPGVAVPGYKETREQHVSGVKMCWNVNVYGMGRMDRME